ncbi:Uncharacterized protein Fot_38197 [Forsythia ovata]|uniref:Uncharacterized protein n=1 Tax=Forsythia ovata TaxID=205694 RepID=A0ABD1S151_9LAMI
MKFSSLSSLAFRLLPLANNYPQSKSPIIVGQLTSCSIRLSLLHIDDPQALRQALSYLRGRKRVNSPPGHSSTGGTINIRLASSGRVGVRILVGTCGWILFGMEQSLWRRLLVRRSVRSDEGNLGAS